ncbi:ABC transporter substrate-binding protein [Natrinema halophilum]|uniref:ABC transporter substrate-binding protein n=1 Tax=Natrinema halophilum TaxID=1699371 RepID=A0A7D5GLT0_9EURY|nr:ABC transporter substrate-binding protein [Natrinema halophilum]QLG47973.1 ABC transporter substrate-binding protein [Natrinema halophilum]
MDVRTFPVLTDEDHPLVARLSVGVGENTARVLAYLLCRRADPDLADPATRTAIHIGAGVSKNAAADALDDLVAADLIDETTAETAAPGRPPKAWYAAESESKTIRRTYVRHANRLIEQGRHTVTALESVSSESGDPCEADSGAAPNPVDEWGDANGSDSTATGVRSAPERASIALNWQSNPLHLPLFAAGDGSASDVSFTFDEYDGSREAASAVASASCDVGVAGAATILRERTRGQPIVPIAVYFQRSMVVLYTTQAAFGGPFERTDQLEGRRIGISSGTETGLLGRLFLEQAGVRDAVELVDIDGEEQAALRSGSVDAVTGMVPDPDRLETAERTVDAVTVSDAYPAYGPALIATERTLRHRKPLLESVLVAAMAGWADAVYATETAAKAFASEIDQPSEHIARTFDRATDRFGSNDAVRRSGWGWHSPDEWRNLKDALAQGGILKTGGT